MQTLDLELLKVARSIGNIHYPAQLWQGEVGCAIVQNCAGACILCQALIAIIVLQGYLEGLSWLRQKDNSL